MIFDSGPFNVSNIQKIYSMISNNGSLIQIRKIDPTTKRSKRFIQKSLIIDLWFRSANGSKIFIHWSLIMNFWFRSAKCIQTQTIHKIYWLIANYGFLISIRKMDLFYGSKKMNLIILFKYVILIISFKSILNFYSNSYLIFFFLKFLLSILWWCWST